MPTEVTDEAVRLKAFWNARYNEFSLRESGILQHSAECSELLYQCKEAAYVKAVQLAKIDRRSPVSILDAGCGQGFFANVARRLFDQPSYRGVDISEKAIQFLSSRMPDFEWRMDDITDRDFRDRGNADVVQSIEVLHLILDDKLHQQAIRNLSAMMSETGTLIFTDTLPQVRTQVGEYIVFRTWDYYKSLLKELSLALIAIIPMYYWMPDGGPQSRIMGRCVRMLPLKAVFWLDRVFLRWGIPPWNQSHDCKMKMMVCRKSPA